MVLHTPFLTSRLVPVAAEFCNERLAGGLHRTEKPGRARECSLAAADSIGEPMAFLVFNRGASSCTVAGPLSLSFFPTTHPTTHPTNHSTTKIIHTLPRASSPILTPSPHMANHRTEKRQPPRERLPSVTTAPALTFHPVRAPSASIPPAAGTVSHPARASRAGNIPIRGPSFAEPRPLPGLLKSASAPQVDANTLLRRSPD